MVTQLLLWCYCIAYYTFGVTTVTLLFVIRVKFNLSVSSVLYHCIFQKVDVYDTEAKQINIVSTININSLFLSLCETNHLRFHPFYALFICVVIFHFSFTLFLFIFIFALLSTPTMCNVYYKILFYLGTF